MSIKHINTKFTLVKNLDFKDKTIAIEKESKGDRICMITIRRKDYPTEATTLSGFEFMTFEKCLQKYGSHVTVAELENAGLSDDTSED